MEDFADWLVQQGYARLHMRATLNVVRKVDRYLRRRGIHRVEDITPLALHFIGELCGGALGRKLEQSTLWNDS